MELVLIMAKQRKNKTRVDGSLFEVQRSFVSRVSLNGNLLAVLESDTAEGLEVKEQSFISRAKQSDSFQIGLFKGEG